MLLKERSILPGFVPAWSYTVLYVSLVLLIPIAALVLKAATLSWPHFWAVVGSPRVVASYRLSLLASLAGAGANAVFGLLIAWVLTRYRFPGRRIIDALIDLPFAMPTAVAGIALTTMFSPVGLLGRALIPLGVKVDFTPLGVGVALTFIGLPFVVRTVQPVLLDLDAEVEEAAASLGASRAQTVLRVILPSILPSWLTGFALAFARALGEYGSVVFISGNLPGKTEISPLIIITKLEQFDYAGAAAVATVMLVFSFLLLLLINLLQWWSARRFEPGARRQPA